MADALVEDDLGARLSPCSEAKARRLLSSGQATLVQEQPLTIRLCRTVALPGPRPADEPPPLDAQRVLLHICCGPCATYVVARLRERGADVSGYWYNPNIHPYGEHKRRRDALAGFAEAVDLPVIWQPGYGMTDFMREVCGHERYRERCAICYRIRLEQTARTASERGYDAFTTTLLISPYQDVDAIRRIGRELGGVHGVSFYVENFRRGFAEHHRMARKHGLYMQRYCGCLYSEWEARDPCAWTHPRG